MKGNENLSVSALPISHSIAVNTSSLYRTQLVFVLFYILKDFIISRDISLNVILIIV